MTAGFPNQEKNTEISESNFLPVLLENATFRKVSSLEHNSWNPRLPQPYISSFDAGKKSI
jgi:hypothetical protein